VGVLVSVIFPVIDFQVVGFTLQFLTDDHFFDAFSSRTCNGHPLPCNSTGGCVDVEDAKKVFDLGDFEYE
jgi:hypothetical protein